MDLYLWKQLLLPWIAQAEMPEPKFDTAMIEGKSKGKKLAEGNEKIENRENPNERKKICIIAFIRRSHKMLVGVDPFIRASKIRILFCLH